VVDENSRSVFRRIQLPLEYSSLAATGSFHIRSSDVTGLLDALHRVNLQLVFRRITSLVLTFQALADVTIQETQERWLRKEIGRLLLKLMDQFNRLPSTLFVPGVRTYSRDAVNAGGYADIFKGIYQGKQVALKRFRTYNVENERLVLNKVTAYVFSSASCSQLVAASLSRNYSVAIVGSPPYLAFPGCGPIQLCPTHLHGITLDEERKSTGTRPRQSMYNL
jgi:hypothetical protein